MKFLATLSEWGSCQSYFLLSNLFECNEFYQTMRLVDRMKPFTVRKYLTEWLLENYVGECVKRCPENIQQMFENIRTLEEIQVAIKEIIHWRNNSNTLSETETLIIAHLALAHLNYSRFGTISQRRRFFSKCNGIYVSSFTSMISLLLAS